MPDDSQHIIAPDVERAVLERAAAFAAAGIVQPEHRSAVLICPFCQSLRLGAPHVGHIAGQKYNRRAVAGLVPIGQPNPVCAR